MSPNARHHVNPVVVCFIATLAILLAALAINVKPAGAWNPTVCPTGKTDIVVPLEKGMTTKTVITVRVKINGNDLFAEKTTDYSPTSEDVKSGKMTIEGVLPPGKYYVEVIVSAPGYSSGKFTGTVECKGPPVVIVPEVPTTPQPEPQPEPEPVAETPEIIEIVTPVPTPTSTSLRIAKTGPSRARVLVNVRYVIRVRNAGRYTAKNVVMRDLIPSGMSFVRSTTKHSFKNGSVVFKLGNIKPNRAKSVTLWLKASANVRGKRTNRATASANNAKTVRAQRTTTFWPQPEEPKEPAVTG